MGTVLNQRDIWLLATSARYTDTNVIITAPVSTFIRTGGAITPSAVLLTADAPVFTSPTYTWSYSVSATPGVEVSLGTGATKNIANSAGYITALTPGQFVTFKVVASQTGYNSSSATFVLGMAEQSSEAIIVTQSRPSVTVPASSDGTVTDFTSTGNTITIRRGTTDLVYNTSGGNNTFTIAIGGVTNIIAGTVSGNTTTAAIYSNISAFSALTGNISFAIIVTDGAGTVLPTITATQNFTKVLAGATGQSSQVLTIYSQYPTIPDCPTGGSYTFTGDVFVPPSAVPPYTGDIVFLARLSTNFNDISNTPLVGTATGNTAIVGSPNKWGVGSASFDGAGDYISWGSDNKFMLGTGDFTISLWVYSDLTASGNCAALCYRDQFGAGYKGWSMDAYGHYSGTVLNLNFVQSDGAGINLPEMTRNAWHFCVVERYNGVITGYVDGVAGTPMNSTYDFNVSNTLLLGKLGWQSAIFQGYVADIKIVKGYAVYKAAHSVPTSESSAAAPVTTDPYFDDVVLLLHGDGANNGTIFTDNSSYARSATRIGTAITSTAQSKFGTASLSCPASSGLGYAYATTLDLASSAFTIECWLQNTGTTGYGTIVDFRGTGAVNTSWGPFIDYVNRNVGIYDGPTATTVIFSGTNTVPSTGTWYHLAVVRSGTTVSVYVNGTSVISGTYNPPATHSSGIRVGLSQASADFFDGYIDDLRITKGVARYTATFTPPTGAFPDVMSPTWSRTQPTTTTTPTWATQVLVSTSTPNVAIPIGTSPNADWTCPPVINAQAGSDSKTLTLSVSGAGFAFDNASSTTATTPASILITANLQNTTGTVVFSATAYNAANSVLGSVGGVTLTGSGNTRTLTAANFNAAGATAVRYVVISATLDDLTDTVSVYRGDGGTSALQVFLDNANHTLPADSAGVVTTYSGSGTVIAVYEGTTELDYDGVGTANGKWTVSASVSSGTLSTIGAITESGNYALVAAHAGMSTNQVTITYTISGKTTSGTAFSFTRPQSLVKALSGGGDIAGDTARIQTPKTPASASATGLTGQICWDSDYIYVCTATNTWKRTPITTW